MSFIAELKQRKVFRVAMVYLVVAWVAIQAASIALPAFDAPAWALRVVILLFALGFPLALLLMWVLDLTPEGIRIASGKVGNKRMAGIAAGLVALALGWYFFGQPALRQQAIAGERSIAVLPFVNMSGDKSNEYFSDGLAETTLDMLAQVKDLKVIARTSSFAFKGKNDDVRTIGKALDAAHLLEGSVQQAGDTVRITVQLIRTSDGVHLWSQRYDRKLADVFSIQDEIATEVVKALQVALPVAEQKHLLRRRTEDVGAYQEYLKGTALLPGRKVENMRRAVAHFERAIALDPGYARAHAAAATALSLLDTYAVIGDAERQRRTSHIERALDLAPDLGEAHIVQAAELERARDLSGAERAFRRGLELAPGYATAYQWFGEFLLYEKGQVRAALPMFERARALDPLSPIIRNEHAFALAVAGRHEQALRENAALIAGHPEFAAAHGVRAELLEMQGDLPGALRAWQMQARIDPDAKARRIGRCRTMARFGALDEARACAVASIDAAPTQRDAAATLSWLKAMEGDFAEALAIAERAPRQEPWTMVSWLLANDRADEALALLRTLLPELFREPLPSTQDMVPADPFFVGAALLRTGATEQGRILLRHGLQGNAGRPHAALAFFGREWWDVFANAELGDLPGACRALQDAVDAGLILDIRMLDVHPFLAPLRAEPCYARILAPARGKAAEQVDAARAAGLL